MKHQHRLLLGDATLGHTPAAEMGSRKKGVQSTLSHLQGKF